MQLRNITKFLPRHYQEFPFESQLSTSNMELLEVSRKYIRIRQKCNPDLSSLSDLEINSFFVVSLIAATLCLFSAWLGPGQRHSWQGLFTVMTSFQHSSAACNTRHPPCSLVSHSRDKMALTRPISTLPESSYITYYDRSFQL